ncbi:MAG: EpsG family protein [Rikenellaceae bacterium]|nr:EpsG family protein [Rikenellaceae bacterium]
MFIYIFLPILLLFLLTIRGKGKVVFALLLLFLINVCRDYSVGYDYGHNYKRTYDNEILTNQSVNTYNEGDSFNLLEAERETVEIGWTMLEAFGKANNLPFSVVNFIAAIIIFIALAYSLKQSPWPILSILLYVLLFRYYATFNTIRQSISAIIFVASIPYIEKRQFIKYLLCCLSAAAFHLSALLMVFIYFLPKIKISFKISLVLIVGAFVMSALNIDMILFSWIYDSGYMFDAYAKYLAIENEYNYPIIYLYVPCVLLLIPYILLSYKLKDKYIDIYQLLFVISIIISVLSIHHEVLFRINEYFRTALIIAIPVLLLRNKPKSVLTFENLVILGCCTVYYSIYLFLNANAIRPYALIFFEN